MTVNGIQRLKPIGSQSVNSLVLYLVKYRNFCFIHFQFFNLQHKIKCAKTEMINRFKNLNPSFLNPLQSVSNYKRQISDVSITWKRTLKSDKMICRRILILTLGLGMSVWSRTKVSETKCWWRVDVSDRFAILTVFQHCCRGPNRGRSGTNIPKFTKWIRRCWWQFRDLSVTPCDLYKMLVIDSLHWKVTNMSKKVTNIIIRSP